MLVYVHGGPEAQSRPGFSPIVQYFAHRGYAVLVTNVRGSTGYGRTYVHQDDVEKRMDAVRDLKHAVDWLVDTGYSRPERIAVMGGSYGGFMTLAAVTTYPDLWGAAVELYGIANFHTFMENTGPWRRVLRATEYGDADRDAELLREISPIHRVDRIRAPLMGAPRRPRPSACPSARRSRSSPRSGSEGRPSSTSASRTRATASSSTRTGSTPTPPSPTSWTGTSWRVVPPSQPARYTILSRVESLPGGC